MYTNVSLKGHEPLVHACLFLLHLILMQMSKKEVILLYECFINSKPLYKVAVLFYHETRGGAQKEQLKTRPAAPVNVPD